MSFEIYFVVGTAPSMNRKIVLVQVIWVCKYASMQVCKYASMQVYKYASTQV